MVAELSKFRDDVLEFNFMLFTSKVFNNMELSELVAGEKFPIHIFNSLSATTCEGLRQLKTHANSV